MKTFNIYQNLARLNDLPGDQAESILRSCSGSQQWARGMAAARPFRMLENLYQAADSLWFSLPPSEWIAAFSCLQNSRQKAASSSSVSRNAGESVSDALTAAGQDHELAEASSLYEDKFGFIFVLCVSGKGSDEVLAICRARLGNSVETELQIAAEEQRKIIEIKLDKLLEQ